MFKRRKSILCLLIAVLMMASASTAAMAASPYETRYAGIAPSVSGVSKSADTRRLGKDSPIKLVKQQHST